MRIFLAGAAGAIGMPLCRLLLADGHEVTGTTRRPEKAAELARLGVSPVVVDVFDAAALRDVVVAAHPEVVIHQLTDLPLGLAPDLMAAARIRNNRIRDEGTRNLIAAAVAAGASRMIAQSIGFAYAPGQPPYVEDAPTDVAQLGVISLERQISAAPLTGIILRYGRLYGPGTGVPTVSGAAPLHVEAAADAARRALHADAGVYNIAEDDGQLNNTKAKTQLGWSADFRL